jgi:hypothetical protein
VGRLGKVPRYLASLPERTARATAALVGGALRETTALALPDAVRGSRLYQATVDRLLRILIELVGDVKTDLPPDAIPADELLKRKAAGNALELASVVAVGFSPLWVLAAASDAMGGSKVYLKALVEEIEKIGLLPAGTDVASYDDLLSRLETSSGVLADAVDVPPLKLADARQALSTLRSQADDLPTPAELAALWNDLSEAAQREGIGPAQLSAALGAAAARAGWEVGNVHVFGFYRESLDALRREGLPRYLRRAVVPYLRGAGGHLRPGRETYTDRAPAWLDARRAGRAAGRPPAGHADPPTLDP